MQLLTFATNCFITSYSKIVFQDESIIIRPELQHGDAGISKISTRKRILSTIYSTLMDTKYQTRTYSKSRDCIRALTWRSIFTASFP